MAYDPYYQLVPTPKEKPFDASRTAMLIIDLQYMDAHPDGWMGRLAKAAGKTELIHIRVKYLTSDCRDGQRSLAKEQKAISSDARDDDFLEMVAPVGDELIIDKTSAGTFNSTAIDQILRNMGIDRLLVTGIVTEGCVELTARDAADRGYYVTLVGDACASSTHIAHYDALQRMSDGGLIK